MPGTPPPSPAFMRSKAGPRAIPSSFTSPVWNWRGIVWPEWPPVADKLAGAFWPGPLTLVLPRSPRIPLMLSPPAARRWASAGPRILSFRRSSAPVVSPWPPPAPIRPIKFPPPTPGMCARPLTAKSPSIVDGGPSQVGLESTVLDLAAAPPRLLRPGMIHAESLLAVMGDAELRLPAPDLSAGGGGPPCAVRECCPNIIPPRRNW
jgi:L-threonylcarbamoyladenylate synthase